MSPEQYNAKLEFAELESTYSSLTAITSSNLNILPLIVLSVMVTSEMLEGFLPRVKREDLYLATSIGVMFSGLSSAPNCPSSQMP